MQFLVLYKTLLALPYSSPAFYTKLETPTIFGHHFFLFIFPFPFSFSISCSFYCLYCLLHFFLFPFYSHKKLVQVQKREKKKKKKKKKKAPPTTPPKELRLALRRPALLNRCPGTAPWRRTRLTIKQRKGGGREGKKKGQVCCNV